MLFNSLSFLIFFPIVVSIYFIIPKKIKYLWLLAASYYFYMCWNVKYAFLLLFSTVVTYVSGLLIQKIKDSSDRASLKQIVVAICVICNLGVLFFFKYYNNAIYNAFKVFSLININVNIPAFDVVLPVGISFYTFQALGYTLDVYRGEIKAEKNIFRYALFVSFFPQLVAGPIERSGNLLKQLARPTKFSFRRFREGMLLMLWGYFLKIVMADRIAIFVDAVYGNYTEFKGLYLVIATILFGIQIYCDFAGYSTIAMGAARILGIKLCENFDAPYLSCSVSEFWRKWHMSLTSWFKDYVYIPLGGNRKGKIRKYFNVMAVFLLSGLWHGAGLSYIVWGGLNGVFQVIGDIIKPIREKAYDFLNIKEDNKAVNILRVILTFALIDFTWIFFRAESFLQAVDIIKSIFSDFNFRILSDGTLFNCGLNKANFIFLLVTIVILLFADYCKKKGIVIRDYVVKLKFGYRCLFFVLVIMFLLIFGKYGPAYDPAKFIYFQF